MWRTNLKVLATAIVVIGFYTMIAHIIPQLESEVPQSLDLSADVTPEVLVAAGERVYSSAGGCTACHGLGTRAPNLLTDHAGQGPIGSRCGSRVQGQDCKAYLYASMTTPNTFVVPGFEPIMPDMRRQIDEGQIWAIIAYLQSLGGEVTVTGADIPKAAPNAGGATGGVGPAGAGGTAMTATMDPEDLYKEKGCIGCHQLGGTGGAVGPSFDGIGRRLSAEAIRRGILFPHADTAKGYEQFGGMMPAVFGQQLSAAQLEALVQFLSSRK
ncbi:MAG: cytochrome c [Gemmatimonadaceae bacterium]